MPNDYIEHLFGLTGQTAVVIGATGTLGSVLAEGLAKAGARVVVAGRGEDRGIACVKRIEQAGGKAIFCQVDTTSRESLEALLQAAIQFGGGRVEMLVNCAGANSPSTYLEAKDEDWHRVIDANLTATHFACQIFGRHMVEKGGGSILNLGSVTADKPLSRIFAYSASKAAVVNLTCNIARELAPQGVRVNAICPGFFPAEQNRKLLDANRSANIMMQTPMARFGEPHELIGTAILLLSRTAGSFITGAAFYVDGGFTAMRL